jgi:uncharacterized protein YjeT (DUF2065 family)
LAWADLFAGLAFYLILEGLFPFIMPDGWRRGIAAIAQLDDKQLRSYGLVIVVSGLVLLFVVRA